jgi:hypothetical protein
VSGTLSAYTSTVGTLVNIPVTPKHVQIYPGGATPFATAAASNQVLSQRNETRASLERDKLRHHLSPRLFTCLRPDIALKRYGNVPGLAINVIIMLYVYIPVRRRGTHIVYDICVENAARGRIAEVVPR